jgi:hypothetical protein
MAVHVNVKFRWVCYFKEHDIFVFKQNAVDVGIGDLGVVGDGIGIASPWRARIVSR